MLPFLLKRLGLDPATSSAPFVATLVDVTGLVIYFTVALVICAERCFSASSIAAQMDRAGRGICPTRPGWEPNP